MKANINLVVFLIINFSGVYPSYAQEAFSSRYNFTYITMDNGIADNYIDHIYKDSQGFLWFSTGGGGIARYDGYEFINFNTSSEWAKLKSNFIREVCEDDFDRLWIVSEAGIDVLCLSSFRIVELKNGGELFDSILNNPSIAITKDCDGALWLCSGGTIYKIVFDDSGDILRICPFLEIEYNIQVVGLKDIDNDGQIWACLGDNIYKLYEDDSGRLSYMLPIPKLETDQFYLFHTFVVKDNEVWIGTNNGVIRYNKNEKVSKIYKSSQSDRFSLSQDYVTDIVVTTEKQLLVSTLMGLNVYNPINDHFERVLQFNKPSANGNNGLNSNFVNCLFVDNEIIWVGTETGGINKITPKIFSIKNYIYDADNSSTISQNPVNAIFEDKNETLWVGTVEGGLNRKQKGDEKFAHFTTPLLSHNSVSAITSDKNNNLWVGTWGNGITVLDMDDPVNGNKKYISMDVNSATSIDFIGSLTYDSINNGIWVGANPGIFFYDLELDSIFSPLNQRVDEKASGCIGSLIDSRNRLWMGAMEGVYIIDLNSRSDNHFSYKFLKYKLDAPNSKLIEKPTCFYESNDGVIWIGTNGYGFYKYEEKNNQDRFKNYTIENGLVNNTVRGILEDHSKRIWISTNNGISCFDPIKEKFINYTKEDGLVSNQFYWNAFCRSKSGQLYFGGLAGLVGIDPTGIRFYQNSSRVVFTKLKIMNEDIYPDGKHIETSISKAKALYLHEREKSFSLEFSALNYRPQTAAVYKYRLLGFDDQWIETPASRRFVSYTNLPHGFYTLQVKYVQDDDHDELPVTELSIIVRPFFFKRPGFIAIVVCLLVGIVVVSYKRRVASFERQKRLLYETVEKRTNELAKQNEKLICQNEKITQQKEELLQMSKKVEELTMDKLSFFTNITHEFRTPITLIIGPTEKALRLTQNPLVVEQLKFVERNSKYLLSLVNQLMDFRKVESGNLAINKSNNDFLKFIDSLIIPFSAFARDRDIQIKTFYRLRQSKVLFDQDAMHKAINNLLSNAIKFTPTGGIVSVYVADIYKTGNDNATLFIGVKDTGTGIDEKDRTRIFDRFYQSPHRSNIYSITGQSSTGIGLYLAKQIVQLHGGQIFARNNKSKGATFCISIPLKSDQEVSSMIDAERDNLLDSVLLPDSPDLVPSHFLPDQLTILVVEDNNDMRKFIRSILSSVYNVLEAENGAVALTYLNTCKIDFIISDLMMPVMDGVDLSRKVKENFAISHIPFLMLTAKTSPEARLESYRVGVDAYLLKPFSEELLLARIDNILKNRKRYQQQFALKMDIEALNIEEDSPDEKFMKKVLEVVKSNYKNPEYNVGCFVQDMGISKSLLNKKMQNLAGQSIGQFIRNYRLTIALELLEKNKVTRNMNVSQIAYETGFNDPKYFTRCFTKRYNVTPSTFI